MPRVEKFQNSGKVGLGAVRAFESWLRRFVCVTPHTWRQGAVRQTGAHRGSTGKGRDDEKVEPLSSQIPMVRPLDILQTNTQNFTTPQTHGFWLKWTSTHDTIKNRLCAWKISSQLLGKETFKVYLLGLANYGDIVNLENGNSYGEDSFVATPTAARQTISHISSCRTLVVVR